MIDSASAISTAAIDDTTPLRARLVRWGLIVVQFSAVQAAVQALGALAGLVIVRTLSKPDYALFAIVNSMQTTCNLLADCGIGIGMRAIGGRVCNDRRRFGELITTALALRKDFAAVSFALALPIAGCMLWRCGAGGWQLIGFCGAIVAAVIPLLGASVWGVSPQLHGEYRRMQRLDLGNAALRALLIGALALSQITALLAALVGVVGNWLQAIFFRRWAYEHVEAHAPVNGGDRRELIGFSRQWLPNIIFFCFQGQLTLLLLSFFGSATDIADLTALGRLTVLFTVFSTTFNSVLAPRFTRCQDSAKLKKLYLMLVGAAALSLLPLFCLIQSWPEAFLWLLGEKYQRLAAESLWVVGAGCIAQLGYVMWSLNSSKGWIRCQSIGYIPAIVAAQIVTAAYLDLSQFHHVLIFNLVTVSAPLPMYALDAWRGLRS
jgi:O-antigen/teichoic acid export membrane protein